MYARWGAPAARSRCGAGWAWLGSHPQQRCKRTEMLPYAGCRALVCTCQHVCSFANNGAFRWLSCLYWGSRFTRLGLTSSSDSDEDSTLVFSLFNFSSTSLALASASASASIFSFCFKVTHVAQLALVPNVKSVNGHAHDAT